VNARRCACLLAAAAAMLPGLAGPARAQSGQAAIKANYLPRFARYVAWPAAAAPGMGAPFQLCVIGRDPFGRLLDSAAARELIDGHPVAVRRVGPADSAHGCHIAFVQGAGAPETSRLLLALRGQPILTVTDARGGAARGMIHFAVIEGRVRFSIDEATAAERGLSISSRLLALAITVRPRRS
jgi:hypothetical protein